MITRLLAASSGALLLLGVAVLPVSAASLTSGTGIIGNAVTSVGATVTGTGSSTSSNMNSGTNVNATVSGNTTGTTGSADVTVGASEGTHTDNSAMTSGTLNVTGSDSAVTNFASDGTTASDPTQVQSSDELNTYADSTLHSDPNIQKAQLSNTMVSMDYKESGRLFGFIPVSITAHAQVDPSGTVTVSYPWYHFLVSTNSDLQTSLQAHVQDTMSEGARNSTSTNGQFSARMQAELLADFENIFNSSADTSATASSTTSASANGTDDTMSSSSSQ